MKSAPTIALLSSLWLLLAGCTGSYSPYVYTQELPGHRDDLPLRLIGGRGADSVKDSCLWPHPNGGYALFGQSISSFNGSTDFLMVRLSEDGEVSWASTYGGTHRDLLSQATPLADGGYLLTGTSLSLFHTPMRTLGPQAPGTRPLAIKVDAFGHAEWVTMKINGVQAVATDDGGFWISGWRWRGKDPEAQTVVPTLQRFNGAGHISAMSQVVVAGEGRWTAIGGALLALADRGVLQMINIPRTPDGDWADARIGLLRWDGSGNVTSAQVIEGPAGITGTGLVGMPDGGVLVRAFSYVDGYLIKDAVLIRLDASGMLQWAAVLEAADGLLPGDIRATPNGGLAMAGRIGPPASGSAGILLALDAEGGNPRVRVPESGHLVEGACLLDLGDGSYGYAGTGLDSNDPNLGNLDILFARVSLDGSASAPVAAPEVTLRRISPSIEPVHVSVEDIPIASAQSGPEIPATNLEYKRMEPPPAGK